MENNNNTTDPTKQAASEQLPTLFTQVSTEAIFGFDTTPSPAASNNEIAVKNTSNEATNTSSPSQIPCIDVLSEPNHHRTISISLPSSPSALNLEQSQRVELQGNPAIPVDLVTDYSKSSLPPIKSRFYSQPQNNTNALRKSPEPMLRALKKNQFRDKRFDSFKTWSGGLERQLTNLRGKPSSSEVDINDSEITQNEAAPAVHRYFDALEGPELETLKSSEELALPEDKKWPFLLRFPISSFGMCLGVSSQAILWKTLATSDSMSFLHISLKVNLILWCISIALISIVALIYAFKIIFYFEAIKREYYHPVRVNFFFAPWISCLFLAIGLPPSIALKLHDALWYVLMTPILCLELKIYGQWMSGGQRRLSKVANPCNHLSIVGNFVGALLGASMGLKEGPIFFFAIGLAHYIVLFVTLYQRLPTNETLPKELHPVFFLFVAAPSVASMAWASICGEFNFGSRIAYFIALFLYVSLAVRINFFRGFRFSLSWWAYTFPMTGAAIATIRYSREVNNWLTEALSVALSGISTLIVTALLVSTILHAFVFHDLFPNDISIAIKQDRSKNSKGHSRRRKGSSDGKDIEACLPI